MMKIRLIIFGLLFLTSQGFSQSEFNFPKDSLTNKFSISRIISMPGKSKSDFFQAFKTVSKQFVYGNSDKLSKEEVSKQMYISYVYDPITDSSRMIFKIIIFQSSTKNSKVLGYKSYVNLNMDMTVYIKEGRYKIELTNYTVGGLTTNQQGAMETIEERHLSDKSWKKLKNEIFDDSNTAIDIVTKSINTYFKKSDF